MEQVESASARRDDASSRNATELRKRRERQLCAAGSRFDRLQRRGTVPPPGPSARHAPPPRLSPCRDRPTRMPFFPPFVPLHIPPPYATPRDPPPTSPNL